LKLNFNGIETTIMIEIKQNSEGKWGGCLALEKVDSGRSQKE